MSTSKHIDKICIAAIAITLVLTILFMSVASPLATSAEHSLGYENRLFKSGTVHKIDIVMNDWDSFIETCENEEYSPCTAVVDGERFSNIAIRAKGNTSLSSVKTMGSQRYSFKLEFDQYEKGKTYYGLDKLCLNNLIQDNTMMKDFLVYQMMDDFGADTPLCSYVYITVNGEDWGLYLAVEGVEDSFLQRNYGSDTGELYKPDSMSFGGGRGNGKEFDMSDFQSDGESGTGNSDGSGQQNSSFPGGQFPQGFGGENSGSGNNGMPQMPSGGFGSENSSSGNENSGSENNGMPQMPGGGFDSGNMPQMPGGGFDSGNMPQMPNGSFNNGSTSQNQGSGSDSGNASQKLESDAGNGRDSQSADSSSADGNNPQIPGGDFNVGDFSQMFGGFGGFGGNDDVKLKYIDDDPDSYPNIFDNAKTDVSKSDKKRLISALKNLNYYTELESTLDMEEVLRYFVVHDFVVNGDSYTGNMIHNYYLHESSGQLSMIPWDYNLAFGTFMGGDASSSVNSSIDNPVSGGSVDDRPMVGWIFSKEEYTDQYHELFSEFLNEWINSGKLSDLIADTAEMIWPCVQKDPTKFCTEEEFETGVTTIAEFISLRGEAVERQLSGDDTPVDAGELNTSAMGSMGGNMGGGFDGGRERPSSESDSAESENGSSQNFGSFPPGNMPDGGKRPGGENAQGFDFSGNSNFSAMQSGTSPIATGVWIGVSVIVLVLGLVIAIRKKY